jgi:hypothetical protein
VVFVSSASETEWFLYRQIDLGWFLYRQIDLGWFFETFLWPRYKLRYANYISSTTATKATQMR